jgi:hypothetical protein
VPFTRNDLEKDFLSLSVVAVIAQMAATTPTIQTLDGKTLAEKLITASLGGVFKKMR